MIDRCGGLLQIEFLVSQLTDVVSIFPSRAVLDLTNLEGELTHSLTCDFQDGAFGSVSLLVTISGTTASETISDLTSVHPSKKEIQTIVNRYVNI